MLAHIGRLRLGNLVAASDNADAAQRGQMLGEIFERLEVDPQGAMIWLVCVPKPDWMTFFRRVTSDAKPDNFRATAVTTRGESAAQGTSASQIHRKVTPVAQRGQTVN